MEYSNNNKKVIKKKKQRKMLKMSSIRAFVFVVLIIILFVVLVGRIGFLQFVQGSYLERRKLSQAISSNLINAKRGTIYDYTGKAIAISANVDTVTVNPEYINVKKNNKIDEEKTKAKKSEIAQKFAEIFELNEEEVLAKLNSEKSVETIVSKVENDKIEKLKEWLNEKEYNAGINIDPDTKRYYPYNNLASNLIGFCGTDNQGIDGIELKYDSILKGTSGRLTTATQNGSGKAIPDKNEQYIAPKDGSNIYLTIDSNIQAIAEKYLKQAVEENRCKRGGNIIIEDPETGKILAMATYPDFNLNTPYTPNEWIAEGFDTLSAEEKSSKLYSMWRNRAVLDAYEPGSTFKVLTAASALEENITETDIAGEFYCGGAEIVNGVRIRCANQNGHGRQSLRNALENSCNPALIQLSKKIGVDTFYKYLKQFGLFDKTGIDLPSETTGTFWAQKNVGPVELATMSFGQRFTITPMQLVKAVSAIANNGVMVTPHIVDRIENTETGNITSIATNRERQMVSKDTAEKLKGIMKDVVEKGGGNFAKVSGYTIGGKTGTSEPDPNHPENGYVSSFLAIAPVENTKLVVLLTLYGPTAGSYYGGTIAAPAVSQILSEVLPYLDIPSNDTTSNNSSEIISVPNVKGQSLKSAKTALENAGLTCKVTGASDEIISEQVPKAGTQLRKNGIVKLYVEGKDDRVSQTVPDLKGVSFEQARIMLEARNLNISSSGSGIVIAQDIKADTQVDEGTIVNVTLQEVNNKLQN